MTLLPRLFVVACVVVGLACKTLPLPGYITPCKMNDPKLDECTTKNGQAALPTLIKGDRKYKIPVLDPLLIEELEIINGNGSVAVELKGMKMKLIGFKDITIKSSKFDLSKKVVTIKMLTPRLSLVGDYSVKGKVLILPITGTGFSNFTLENVDLTYVLKYKLVKKADGQDYIVPYDNNMSFVTTQAHIRMDNLFNGDKALSDNMILFMNQNWEILIRELGPSIAEAIGNILQQVLKDALKDVPYKNIFLLK